MPITDWPKDDRPREKLLARGAAALSEAELLAIFLRTGVKGKSAVRLAQDLIDLFHGLRPLLSANFETLRADKRIKGLGLAKYAQLQAALEMARRHLLEGMKQRDALKDPRSVKAYLQSRLRESGHEVFAALLLDNQHRVIEYVELAQGTLDGASVYPREVVKAALRHGAAAVIFAHNHPSGVAEPSAADRVLTDRLKAALALVDIRVLDHFVVGEEVVSFAERGWI
ncbi:MAG: DNA repair protein RadC [Hydrocarboniphaga effusa]|nr:DNA repair protein RadC [Hydrocarboniphaga effusa]